MWSAQNLRDTVADPNLIVINKGRYGSQPESQRTSESTETAGFGRSPSEIIIKNNNDRDIELSTNFSSLSPRKTVATDPFRVDDRVICAGG